MTAIDCFSTLGCPQLTLEEVLTLASAHRMPAVELRALEGTVDLPACLADRFGSPQAFGDCVQSRGIAIAALGTSEKLMGDRFDLEMLAEFARWAEAAGAPYLRIFDGGENAPTADDFAVARERLDRWQMLRAQKGWTVDLMVETHDGLCDPEPLRAAVQHLPGIMILWDTHHTWRKGGADPLATWKDIAANVVHLHVKDSVGTATDYGYVVPGRGDFPWPALAAQLEADEFAGRVSLEWEKMWHPSLPDISEALQGAADWH